MHGFGNVHSRFRFAKNHPEVHLHPSRDSSAGRMPALKATAAELRPISDALHRFLPVSEPNAHLFKRGLVKCSRGF